MKKHLAHLAAALAVTLLFGAAAGPLSAAAATPTAILDEENTAAAESRLSQSWLDMEIEHDDRNPVCQLYLSSAAPDDWVYQWYSTNPAVATVDRNGLVTAQKPGKATITAVAAGKAHPYHLKAISGGGSTVYGWVNAADISTGSTGTATSYRVRTTANVLNIRKGPGTNYGVAGQIKGKGIYTIVAEAAGPGATKWGKLKSGAGWISLDYVTKL